MVQRLLDAVDRFLSRFDRSEPWSPHADMTCAYCGCLVDETRFECCAGCVDELGLDDGYWSEGMPRYN